MSSILNYRCVYCDTPLVERRCPKCKIIYEEPSKCISTHGEAGYPVGARLTDRNTVICPICGAETPVRKEALGWHVNKGNVRRKDNGR